ncbi:hypothetical protein GGR50DRAFT_547302 [Xylaria sp. CBS 124048]|nr:hypothetical protein GGR50DRAFT_547302 [Xylaria sp. CBS 124048]
MPRLPSNINQFQEKIAASYAAGDSIPSILRSIKEQGCDCTQRTLERRIQLWGLQRHALSVHTDAVVSRIQFLFFVQGWTDEYIKDDLERAGVSTTVRTIQNIRLKHGMRRRFRKDEDRFLALRQSTDWMQQHVQRGPGADVGRSYIYEFVRTQAGIIVGKNQVFQYHKSRWSDEVREEVRDNQSNTYRDGMFVIPGRNFLWCFDALAELRMMGIEIYVCVDVYSRMILWMYVGPSSCAAMSTLKQFLRTIAIAGVRPLLTASDIGSEPALFAGAQGLLAESDKAAISYDGPDDEELTHQQGSRLSSCHIWGYNEENTRIGSWWRTMRPGSPDRWRRFAEELCATGLLRPHDDNDLIAVYAIYGPMLRTEITEFAQLWNTRRQDHHHVTPGKPAEIYEASPTNWGIPIEEGSDTERLLRTMTDTLEKTEVDAFLPQETEDWCNSQLEELGFNELPRGQVDYKHPHIRVYVELRRRVRAHRASGQRPRLSTMPRPVDGGTQYVALLNRNHPVLLDPNELHGDPIPSDMLDGIRNYYRQDEEREKEPVNDRAAQP